MPEGAIYVGRPGRWGNPFRSSAYTAEQAVRLYRTAIMGALPLVELRGHDLACWCALDQPCHADVLLELANRDPL